MVAAKALQGPCRVVAGAGTGKTAVIAERFRRLVRAGARPDSILVMTFTDRAASEMRERIRHALGGDEELNVGTFHSIAQRWLREDGSRVGAAPGFTILAGADRWILLRELMWELADPELVGVERPDELVTPLLRMLERLKQELVPLARLSGWASAASDRAAANYWLAATRLFEAYGQACRRRRLLDFDDLLVKVVELLEGQAAVRNRYRRKFPWLMVDEYQDTNLAQERMVEILAGAAANVCAVGDDDQSIYRFRGASRAGFERFLSCFPAAITLTLGRNRRSTRNVVTAAAAVIINNRGRIPKRLAATAEAGPPVEVWAFGDGSQEAGAIAERVAAHRRQGFGLGQMAVLTRTNAIATPVVEALAAARLPHRHCGAHGFYQRPEVRDLIAYLQLVDSTDRPVALLRLLTRPPLCLDAQICIAVLRAGMLAGRKPLDVLEEWAPATELAAVLKALQRLKSSLGVDELFFELMAGSAHLEHLIAADPTRREQIAANVGRFAELVGAFCERERDQSLGAFAAYLELVLLSGVDEDQARVEEIEDAVQVMTIHQAKGLEFEAVFIPALVEGRLPQPARTDRFDIPTQVLEPYVRGREDHLAEERRLLYVAMTRARRHLHLSWAERYEGAREWRPSRFLEEVRAPGARSVVDLDRRAASVPGRAAAAARPARPAADSIADQEPLRLSFSAISAYRECPRQYWYRYQQMVAPTPSVDAQFGSVVHEVLRRAGEICQMGGGLELDRLRALYEATWQVAPELAEPRRRPALERIGWTQLEAYFKTGGLAAQPEWIEHHFTADIDNWRLRGIIDRVDPPPPPTQMKGGEVGVVRVQVTGPPGGEPGAPVVVDVADAATAEGAPSRTVQVEDRPHDAMVEAAPVRHANSDAAEPGAAWRLIDYKTGAAMPASRLRRDLQLALYALGAQVSLGFTSMELEIVYLKDGKRVIIPVTDDLLEEARRVGGEVAEAIAGGRFEPAPERRRCRLCSYRLACEAAL